MSVLVRAAVGLALALVLPRLPALAVPDALIGLLFAAGFLTFAAARALAFVEPATRDALLAAPQSLLRHIGEALFAASLLLLAVLALDPLLATTDHPGAVILVVVAYLLAHTLTYVLLEGLLSPRPAPPRPRLRRAIRGAAALTEQVALATAMTLTESARRGMLAGPWALADVATLPLVSVFYVLLMVVPLMRLARAAADGPVTPIRDVVALHVAALYLHALLGPWVP